MPLGFPQPELMMSEIETMKVIVHYRGKSPGFGNERILSRDWKHGEDSLDDISSMSVEAISVFGSALAWIRRNVTGIPMMAGAGEEEQELMNCTNTDFSKPIPIPPIVVKSLVWHGDDAKFLAGVIPGLLH